jgi:hypothetical protein
MRLAVVRNQSAGGRSAQMDWLKCQVSFHALQFMSRALLCNGCLQPAQKECRSAFSRTKDDASARIFLLATSRSLSATRLSVDAMANFRRVGKEI